MRLSLQLWTSWKSNLNVEVIALGSGFKEHIGVAIINLALEGFLCDLSNIKY